MIRYEPDQYGRMKQAEHGGWVTYAACQQATIAALQARLDERLEFIKDCDIALDRIQAPRTNEGQEELVSTWRRIELVGSLLSQYRSTLEQMSTQLTQRTVERDTARRRVDELEAREVDVVTLREDLEQRTAELEAIEKILDIDSGKTTVEKVRDLHHSFKQVWESYQDASNEMFKAQAELERVRGELAEAHAQLKEYY